MIEFNPPYVIQNGQFGGHAHTWFLQNGFSSIVSPLFNHPITQTLLAGSVTSLDRGLTVPLNGKDCQRPGRLWAGGWGASPR